MAIVFLLLSVAITGCLCCNARTMPKNKAKIVEEYVVSAKFDENTNLPQLNERNQFRKIYEEEEMKRRPEAGESSVPLSFTSRENHKASAQMMDDFEDGNTLEERDLLVHHHHIPPPPHPPPPPVPPPPPPVGLTYAPSLFAIGLITFLILLNSLQTSLLLILKSKGSVLGSVTGALGRRRRKRFVVENFGKPRGKYEKLELDLT